MTPDELKTRLTAWMNSPVKDFEDVWRILDEAGEHKLELSFDQDGRRRSIILVQGDANVRRASALLEDL